MTLETSGATEIEGGAMARILVLAGQKGGVGKSTVALCLAAEAQARGRSVLLVDADPQGSVRTWGEAALEAGVRAPTVVAMGATMHRDGQLHELAAPYDLAIVDCPPRHGDIQRSALLVADVAILPCGPGAMDAWAIAASVDLIQEAKKLRPLAAYVLLTRKQARTTLGEDARRVLSETGLPILMAELGYRVAYQEAIADGKGTTTYAPHSRAAAEIRALYEEVTLIMEGSSAEARKARLQHPKAAG